MSALGISKSTPSFTEFDPTCIKMQAQVLHDIETQYDYTLGVHDVLLSGAVGSSKSLLAAHIAVKNCILYPKSRWMLGRRSLPDLKDTIFQTICEHLEDEKLVQGIDYFIKEQNAYIYFKNGSEIISRSWADKKYRKFRSLALSGMIIEELTENDEKDSKAFFESRQRVGRLSHIKHNLIICCTNPDSPSHWAYKYFIDSKSPTRHVYYSKTEDNPFLPASYIEGLKASLDPMEARRQLYGEWIEINKERIYYAYNTELNFIRSAYKINEQLPIAICFDFNIGAGKPMSAVVAQHVTEFVSKKQSFHFFDESIIEGARTLDTLEELSAKGIFDLDSNPVIEVYGDATGAARSTNSLHSNYDIIRNYLSTYKRKDLKILNFAFKVPKANPPIRERHNVVNSYCENSLGERRLFVYENCKGLHDGLRLTALKAGASYIEDDSFRNQHCTTALGYFVVYKTHHKNMIKGGNIG